MQTSALILFLLIAFLGSSLGQLWTGSYEITADCTGVKTCCCAPLDTLTNITQAGTAVTFDTFLLGTSECGNLTEATVTLTISGTNSFQATGSLGPISLNCTLSLNSVILICHDQFGCSSTGTCLSGPNCAAASTLSSVFSLTILLLFFFLLFGFS